MQLNTKDLYAKKVFNVEINPHKDIRSLNT